MSPAESVLFIATSSNASPARGGRRRIVDVAHQSTRIGIASQIVCFLPFEQVLRGFTFLKNGKQSLAQEAKVPVHYWPMIPLTRFALFAKLNQWWCGLVTALLCRFNHLQLVHGHGIKAGDIGLKARRMWRNIKVVTDVHGAGSAEYAYHKQLQPGDKTLQRLEKFEKTVITQSDQVIFVSHRMHRYYQHKLGRELDHSSVIPCAINARFTADPAARENLRKKYNLEDKLVLAYAGSAVAYQLVYKMCVLFSSIHQCFPSAHFLILSHQTDQFQRQLAQHEIEPTHYSIFSVEHSAVFSLLQMGDIGLMLRDDSILNQVASPTKFAEYLHCGLPVITTQYVGDYSQWVAEHRLGFIIDLANMQVDRGLEDFINYVVSNRSEISQRCAGFVKDHLVWELYGEKLWQIYND